MVIKFWLYGDFKRLRGAVFVAPRIHGVYLAKVQFLNNSSLIRQIGLFSAKMAMRSSRIAYW